MAVARAGARTRARAAQVVDAVASGGKSLDDALASFAADLPAAELPLLRALSFGALRYYWRLDEWLGRCLNKRMKRRDSVIEALLLVGFQQLSAMRIPAHAAVSETVDAVRLLERPQHARLVNAVLRRFAREDLARTEPVSDAARYNHPDWILEALRRDWPDDWREIVAANDERAPMWLRVNVARCSRAGYVAMLGAAAIPITDDAPLPEAVRLVKPVTVAALPGFTEGLVSVQDAAAQLAAPWLLRGIDGAILDACAAPGGKSAHLAEVGGKSIGLTCIDVDPARVEMIRETMARLGHAATIKTGDASHPKAWHDGEPYRGILVDAPCSASGVIRRHPDIKHLRRPGDLDRLAERQAKMLRALWSLLMPGGRLLYVTCSVFSRENEEVVGAFVRETGDARENDMLPNNNIRDVMRRKAYGFQLLPGTIGMDGFYFACLDKVS